MYGQDDKLIRSSTRNDEPVMFYTYHNPISQRQNSEYLLPNNQSHSVTHMLDLLNVGFQSQQLGSSFLHFQLHNEHQ